MAALSSPDPSNRRLSGGNRRLSGGGRRLSGWRPEDVENFFDENDDDKEREAAAEQRKAEQLAKEKTRSPFRETPGHQKRRQIYTDCIQMAAEDRVNAQNSWHLDLIDHMGHMIAEPGGADAMGQPNFQMASTTLDAGVKIYSYRVDSVFNQTFKLVGGLNRTSRPGATGDDGAEDADDAIGGVGGDGANGDVAPGADDEKKKQVSAKKAAAAAAAAAAGTAHLEDNVDKLNLTKLDVSFDVDPLFHRTSAKFDEGGASGLLLNNLSVHRGCELVFDSCDALADAPGAAKVAAPPIPVGALDGLLPAEVTSKHVAKEFVDFWSSINGSGPATADGDDDDEDDDDDDNDAAAPDDDDDDDEAHTETAAAPMPTVDDELATFDEDEYDEDVAAREAMLSAQEGALGGDEDGAAAFMSLDEFAQENGRRASLGGNVGATEEVEVLAPEVAAARGLLSAHAQKLLHVGQRWAGPGHWKFRAPPAGAKSGGGGGEPKGRKARAAFVIDFGEGARLAQELESAAPPAKGSTQLTAAARAKAKAVETTLPHDYHCSIDVLENLFDKPSHRVSYATRRLQRKAARATAMQKETTAIPAPATGVDDRHAEEEFDDDDGAMGGGDFFDDNDDDGEMLPDALQDEGLGKAGGDEAPQAVGSGFEFVAAPTRVAKIDIGYAKRAKQVDIKALKEDVWALLQEESRGQGKGKGTAPREVSFQRVLGRLHERMPAAKLEEVSFAYCFICLLHLANEKSLEVLGDQSNMADMTVRLPAS